MANKYYFGEDLTVFYHYREDSEPSTDSPTIYLFEDMPTRAEASAGTGAIKTISSWSDSERDFAKKFTVTAVSDPDATSSNRLEDYFLAINYTLQASGDTVTDIQEIFIERPIGNTSSLNVNVRDIIAVESQIYNDLDEGFIESKIEQAINEMKLELKKQGYEFDKVKNKHDLKLPVIYKTIAEISLSQLTGLGDDNDVRNDKYEAKFLKAMKYLEIQYDRDGDGDVDLKAKPKRNFAYNIV